MEEIKELTQLSYAMFGNLDASKKSSKKKRKSDDDERDGEINHMLAKMCMNCRNDNDSSESESDAYAYAYPIRRKLPPPKKTKTTHRCSEVVAMMKGSTEPLHVLLDSGTSSCIVLKKHVDRKNLSKYKGKPTFTQPSVKPLLNSHCQNSVLTKQSPVCVMLMNLLILISPIMI
jgi:hypothetical protein